jgi:subtilase family serine protease
MIRRWCPYILAILAFVSAGGAVCKAQSLTPLTRHVREATLNGKARLVGHLPASQVMRIVLVLPLRNQAELDNFLRELYDPSSASYRKFLTVDEFTERFGPTQEDYDAVIQFAEANGLTTVGTSRNRVNVDVSGPVEKIEQAFHLSMAVYQHPTENRTFYAPDREPTPYLAVQLWHIAGLDNYSIPRPALKRRDSNGKSSEEAKSNGGTGSGPSASFLGSDMRAAYYGGTALSGSGQSLGLLEYYGTNLADLNTYFKNVGQTNKVPITVKSTDGTSTSCVYPGCDDTEQTLDMTQALGMAPGMSKLVMYVGSSDASIFNAMATASPLNAQLSSSWTWYPADPSTDDPYFEEFATQGQNLFQATGDEAAWVTFSQIYPADNVYVTGVGGTDLETSSAGGPWSSETAWVDGGGGISPDLFAIPSWQTATASGCSVCSPIYRNGPDVSANANFSFYACADKTCTANEWGGTSFAAPMWAGYLALVNQQAVANGNGPVGFINPTLYTIGLSSSYDTDFHDITSGENGYEATTGYDLATGWGSPNRAGLINAIAGTSSSPGFTLSASPGSVSVMRGSSGNTTITSTVTNGFNSAISLSATGLPAGVTVGFNPTSITGAGTSTMTIMVAASTATGTYNIAVTGTSGGTTQTATLSLTVSGATSDGFTLSASPTTISVTKPGSGTSTITTLVSGGFDSAISLSATGEGGLQTVTFSPSSIAAPGSGTSTMTVNVSKNALVGNHKMTITATGGGVTHTTTVMLVILK